MQRAHGGRNRACSASSCHRRSRCTLERRLYLQNIQTLPCGARWPRYLELSLTHTDSSRERSGKKKTSHVVLCVSTSKSFYLGQVHQKWKLWNNCMQHNVWKLPYLVIQRHSYHNNVIFGHVFRQLLYVAPVGGLLMWDDDVWRQDIQRPHIWRQDGWQRVGAQHQHSLHSRVDPGQVQLLQRGKWFFQKSIDDVHGSLLTNPTQKTDYV